MPVDVLSHQEDDYLLIKASGIIADLKELLDLTTRFYNAAMKYQTRNVVIDEMQVQLTNSILHQVELVKFCSENLPAEIKQWKLAVAVNPKYKELAEFWNLYGSNRGFPWKGFTSLEEALKWIKRGKE